MKKFRTIDDVTRDKREEEKAKAKEEISTDITDILNKILPKKQKKKFSWIKGVGVFIILLVFITIILGCVWAIKFFIGGIF